MEGKLNKLVEWAVGEGAEFSRLELRLDTVGMGVGAYARQPIPASQPYITIPSSLVITQEVAQRHLQTTRLTGQPALAAFLIQQQRAAEDSFWQPYIQTLPTAFSTPLYFTEEELEYLGGTPLEYAARDRHRQYQGELDQVKELDVIPSEALTYENYLWAVSVLGSRSFTNDSQKQGSQVLLPLIDMINHRPRLPAQWVFSPEGAVQFSVAKDIPRGEQVYTNYGAKPNETLLSCYGFCLPNNEFNYYRIRLNYRQDPLYQQKHQLLASLGLGDTDSLDQYISMAGWSPQLMAILRVMAMGEMDIGRPQETMRLEIKSLQLLEVLLKQKLSGLDDRELPEVPETENKRLACMYRKEIHEILVNALESVRTILEEKSEQARQHLITAESLDRDPEFKEAIQQVDLDEDTLLVLYLLRMRMRMRMLKQAEGLSDIDYAVSDQEFIEEVTEVHASLFPLLTEHFENVFAAEYFTLELFLWAAGIVEACRVSLKTVAEGGQAEGILLV